MTSPLTKLESSEAKNKATFATSIGSPLRGLFVAPDITLSIPNSLDSPPAISVFTPPGAIALQRMPFVAYWKPTFLVKPTTACFARSEEHTSELQSRFDLVCRLLLEKKK